MIGILTGNLLAGEESPRRSAPPQNLKRSSEEIKLLRCFDPVTKHVALRGRCEGREVPLWILLGERWVRIDANHF
ncbi:MAG: hypothetical protein HQL55_19305 [Magnetococcales bacterium]|nr:hypothetical protein [Magnetococcales bacterium]